MNRIGKGRELTETCEEGALGLRKREGSVGEEDDEEWEEAEAEKKVLEEMKALFCHIRLLIMLRGRIAMERNEEKRLELEVEMGQRWEENWWFEVAVFPLHADKFLMPENGIDDVDGYGQIIIFR